MQRIDPEKENLSACLERYERACFRVPSVKSAPSAVSVPCSSSFSSTGTSPKGFNRAFLYCFNAWDMFIHSADTHTNELATAGAAICKELLTPWFILGF